MRIHCGIWERLDRRCGGIGEYTLRYAGVFDFEVLLANLRYRFLVKDAEDDLMSVRLKA